MGDSAAMRPVPSAHGAGAGSGYAQVLTAGISEMVLAERPDQMLATHSLGSCLGLVAFDPKLGVAGLVHCLLPRARDRKNRPDFNPYMYVDTGVPALVRALYAKGAARSRLVFKAAGCAHMMNVSNAFDIGRSNCETLRKLMRANDLKLAAEDTGGTIPRTLRFHMADMRAEIASIGRRWDL